LNAAATILLWLYLTGAAIFIGGEANSEIEKAAAEAGHPDVREAGERRSGGEAVRTNSVAPLVGMMRRSTVNLPCTIYRNTFKEILRSSSLATVLDCVPKRLCAVHMCGDFQL
jgi:hypothetical protein